ncbi:hypothetical protein H4S07_002384 [Coemansia furcata]|uniref:Uncharacterized protein n=1 Tax=Coemansia furcata TaxID=417177 RepID=A0ACC1LLT8_9FUNG|nr:hypothetical protein H4S07_002384 [Coemansia furcata]
MLSGSTLAAAIAALASCASAQYAYGGSGAYFGAGASGYSGSMMGYAGAGYAGVGFPGMGYSNMGYYGANMGGISSPWAYGNAGGYIPTGMGHGIIQGASTSGAIIQGPSGTIIAAPQSAGSIVF